MRPWQPLQPDEVTDPDAGYDDHVDRSDAVAMGRELESASIMDPVQPSPEFVDSVMAAIEREPAPRVSSAIVAPLRRAGLGGLLGSVRSAIAMVSLGAGRPLAARAAALGYLVAVGAVGLALGGGAVLGTAGALGLLDDPDGPAPTPIVAPSSSPEPSTSVPSATPTATAPQSAEPSESAGPSGSPEPLASAGPSKTPEPGATRTPTASPSDTADPSESPDPSETPESSKTPKPSDTPEPSETP